VRRSFPLLSALALLVVVSGCAPDDADLGPAATLGTAPTSVPTTARPIDVAVIPDDPADIDEAYVQAVVDALYRVDAQAGRIFIETMQLDDEAIDILRSIYVPEELDRQVDIWFQDLAQRGDELLPGMLENDVQRIIDVADDCVYVEVSRNYSDTTTRPSSPREIYLGLTPKAPGDDPEGVNETAWMLFMDGLNPDGSEPENPCAGR
jgi:hypothetical protein